MVKSIFSVFFRTLHGLSLVYGLWTIDNAPTFAAFALVLLVSAPLLQLLIGFDTYQVAHHKVRLPVTSLLVLLGLGAVLVSIDSRSTVLWLALANAGAFLLDIYWARVAPQRNFASKSGGSGSGS